MRYNSTKEAAEFLISCDIYREYRTELKNHTQTLGNNTNKQGYKITVGIAMWPQITFKSVDVSLTQESNLNC
jgi:hypothetical protein